MAAEVEWTKASTGQRRTEALRNALTLSYEVMRASLKQPTIRPVQVSVTAQRKSQFALGGGVLGDCR